MDSQPGDRSIANSQGQANDRAHRCYAPWWPACLFAAILGVALVGFGFATHGKPLAEKTVTALALPVGALWLISSGRLIQLVCMRPRSGLMPVFVLWLLLFTCGTRPLPRWLALQVTSALPQTYEPKRDGKLDVVAVLGGGTSQGYWRPQAAGAGDRLVMAAELYNQGYAKRLITTGEGIEGVTSVEDSPGKQTIEIWTKLGIPREHIQVIGGRNTSEEMVELKKIADQWQGQRFGVLTSDLHLPRAVRLARAQGLDVVPIAADVHTVILEWSLLNFLPSASNLNESSQVIYEILAGLVKR